LGGVGRDDTRNLPRNYNVSKMNGLVQVTVDSTYWNNVRRSKSNRTPGSIPDRTAPGNRTAEPIYVVHLSRVINTN